MLPLLKAAAPFRCPPQQLPLQPSSNSANCLHLAPQARVGQLQEVPPLGMVSLHSTLLHHPLQGATLPLLGPRAAWEERAAAPVGCGVSGPTPDHLRVDLLSGDQ